MKHIVGFSGGIDSQATADWLLERVPKEDVILVNSDAGGNEDPLTGEFVDWYSENIHPVVRVSPLCLDLTDYYLAKAIKGGLTAESPLTFDLLAALKGLFPSRTRQFCTEFLKLRPQRRWQQEVFGVNGTYEGEDFERYAGVRGDESQGRAKMEPHAWDDFFDCWLNLPLFAWKKKECFDFVIGRGERINDLYTIGFNRVGCAPCVNSNKDDILAWIHRRPHVIPKLREWEQKTGRTYFAPMVPGLRINWIDDVVLWAQTSRGGRQQNFLRVINDRPACESKYGLCE